jgi:predicted SAM-dependent methyltransferase
VGRARALVLRAFPDLRTVRYEVATTGVWLRRELRHAAYRPTTRWKHALVLRRMRPGAGLLLDVGAGTHHLDGWLSLDVRPDDDSLYLDAARPWPLPDRCARGVRSEHMIEHLSFDDARSCICEMYRVLEPGGVCRICTPDLEGIAHAYLGHDERLLELHRKDGYAALTWSHLPNNYMRVGDHRHLFDFDALRSLLEEAGFREIERTPFNHSRHTIVDGTDSHDPGGLEAFVLCVDAVK